MENYGLGSLLTYNPNMSVAQQVYPYQSIQQLSPQIQPIQDPTYPNLNLGSQVPNYLRAGNSVKPDYSGISGWDTAGNVMGGLGSLLNAGFGGYLGLKAYDIAKDQLGMQQEQWQMTKDELNRLKAMREGLSQAYMS